MPESGGRCRKDQHSVWEFIVNYTASFSPNELNLEFEDATRLLEKDQASNDPITPYQKPQTFIAGNSSVEREFSITVFRSPYYCSRQ